MAPAQSTDPAALDALLLKLREHGVTRFIAGELIIEFSPPPAPPKMPVDFDETVDEEIETLERRAQAAPSAKPGLFTPKAPKRT